MDLFSPPKCPNSFSVDFCSGRLSKRTQKTLMNFSVWIFPVLKSVVKPMENTHNKSTRKSIGKSITKFNDKFTTENLLLSAAACMDLCSRARDPWVPWPMGLCPMRYPWSVRLWPLGLGHLGLWSLDLLPLDLGVWWKGRVGVGG